MYRKLYPSTICFRSFFTFLFFVCQTWRIASLPFDATSSHAFACFCVEQQKTIFITNYSLFFFIFIFLRKCKLDFPACWTCMVFFFFMCLNMSFLSDEHGIHTFIYGLLTFLGQQQKSDRTSHPPLHKCISAVLKCTTSGCH